MFIPRYDRSRYDIKMADSHESPIYTIKALVFSTYSVLQADPSLNTDVISFEPNVKGSVGGYLVAAATRPETAMALRTWALSTVPFPSLFERTRLPFRMVPERDLGPPDHFSVLESAIVSAERRARRRTSECLSCEVFVFDRVDLELVPGAVHWAPYSNWITSEGAPPAKDRWAETHQEFARRLNSIEED